MILGWSFWPEGSQELRDEVVSAESALRRELNTDIGSRGESDLVSVAIRTVVGPSAGSQGKHAQQPRCQVRVERKPCGTAAMTRDVMASSQRPLSSCFFDIERDSGMGVSGHIPLEVTRHSVLL